MPPPILEKAEPRSSELKTAINRISERGETWQAVAAAAAISRPAECPGYCGAQDTFYVGTLKGVGRIYQQTFIDTYAKVAFDHDRANLVLPAYRLSERGEALGSTL